MILLNARPVLGSTTVKFKALFKRMVKVLVETFCIKDINIRTQIYV
jgi:hypothetical protein